MSEILQNAMFETSDPNVVMDFQSIFSLTSIWSLIGCNNTLRVTQLEAGVGGSLSKRFQLRLVITKFLTSFFVLYQVSNHHFYIFRCVLRILGGETTL